MNEWRKEGRNEWDISFVALLYTPYKLNHRSGLVRLKSVYVRQRTRCCTACLPHRKLQMHHARRNQFCLWPGVTFCASMWFNHPKSVVIKSKCKWQKGTGKVDVVPSEAKFEAIHNLESLKGHSYIRHALGFKQIKCKSNVKEQCWTRKPV